MKRLFVFVLILFAGSVFCQDTLRTSIGQIITVRFEIESPYDFNNIGFFVDYNKDILQLEKDSNNNPVYTDGNIFESASRSIVVNAPTDSSLYVAAFTNNDDDYTSGVYDVATVEFEIIGQGLLEIQLHSPKLLLAKSDGTKDEYGIETEEFDLEIVSIEGAVLRYYIEIK